MNGAYYYILTKCGLTILLKISTSFYLIQLTISAGAVGSNIQLLSTCVKSVGHGTLPYKDLHGILSVLFYTHLGMV